MELRYYQKQAIANIEKGVKSNKHIFLLHQATGTGKTVVFGTYAINRLIENSNKKILILAHRKELLSQAEEKINSIQIFKGTNFIIRYDDGENSLTPEAYQQANIIVASVQALGRSSNSKRFEAGKRLIAYNPEDFQLVIIDEAHHAISSTYLNIIDHLGVLYTSKTNKYTNKECALLGVTATPLRSKKGETLKQVFPEITYRYTLADGIRDKFLANIKTYSFQTGTNLGNIKLTAGDYNQKELDEKINTPERNLFIVRKYLEHCKTTEPTIMFASSIEHAAALVVMLKKYDITAECVIGETEKEKREEIYAKFRTGETSVLVNVAVLTEGFDIPEIRNVILARPTKSPVLYTQMVGRGTRICEGKEFCSVFDFIDRQSGTGAMDLLSVMGLQTGKVIDYLKKKKVIKRDDEPVDLETALKYYEDTFARSNLNLDIKGEMIDMGMLLNISDEFDQLTVKKSKYAWINISKDNWVLPLKANYTMPDGRFLKYGYFRLEQIYENEYELTVDAIVDSIQKTKKVDIYYDIKEVDNRVGTALEKWGMQEVLFVKSASWRNYECSQSQKDYIWNLVNKNYKDRNYLSKEELAKLTKGDAGVILNLINYELNKNKFSAPTVESEGGL